jgi:hypothetical protein
MRLMESCTLRDRLADGRLPPADALRLLDRWPTRSTTRTAGR